MIVVVDQAVFRAAPSTLHLLELFTLCREERHALLTDPDFDEEDGSQEVTQWLGSLTERLPEELVQILEHGLLSYASMPQGAVSIQVIEGCLSDWPAARLALPDALQLLAAPLKILLESRHADLAFLKRLAPPTHRRNLENALARRWVEIENGCGIDGIASLLDELVEAPEDDMSAAIRRLRLWVMFDRDSCPADRAAASKQSESVRGRCEQLRETWPIGYVQLARRAIENYLPIPVLQKWVDRAKGDEKTTRRNQVAALAEMNKHAPQARWQYNMKRGLCDDLNSATRKTVNDEKRSLRDDDLDPIFRGLGRTIRDRLGTGFGRRVASLYDEAWADDEVWFPREYDRGPTGQPSRGEIANGLLAMI